MSIKPETIGDYIDLPIVQFIEKCTLKSFAELNGMLQLMEAEQIEICALRESEAKKMGTISGAGETGKEYELAFTAFLTTFVLEQKIVDRIEVLKHLKQMKGVENVMSNVQDMCSKAPQGLNLEGTTSKQPTGINLEGTTSKGI